MLSKDEILRLCQELLTLYNNEILSNIYAKKINVLEKNNKLRYIPTSNYHPATKKYVDDSISNISIGGNYDDTEIRASISNINKNKYDDVSISGNELSMKANGIVKKTITLPSGGDVIEGHTHANKTTIDKITDSKLANYDIAFTHSQTSHAPTNAQKNSDITKAEIEARLAGDISTHTHNTYVNKVTGKGLSTNDYTNAEKTKLQGIEANANNYAHPSKHSADIITEDTAHRFTTDVEKNKWNNKIQNITSSNSQISEYANIIIDETRDYSISSIINDSLIGSDNTFSANKIDQQYQQIENQKYDDISISGNELSMKAKGIVKKTVTLPSGGRNNVLCDFTVSSCDEYELIDFDINTGIFTTSSDIIDSEFEVTILPINNYDLTKVPKELVIHNFASRLEKITNRTFKIKQNNNDIVYNINQTVDVSTFKVTNGTRISLNGLSLSDGFYTLKLVGTRMRSGQTVFELKSKGKSVTGIMVIDGRPILVMNSTIEFSIFNKEITLKNFTSYMQNKSTGTTAGYDFGVTNVARVFLQCNTSVTIDEIVISNGFTNGTRIIIVKDGVN